MNLEELEQYKAHYEMYQSLSLEVMMELIETTRKYLELVAESAEECVAVNSFVLRPVVDGVAKTKTTKEVITLPDVPFLDNIFQSTEQVIDVAKSRNKKASKE